MGRRSVIDLNRHIEHHEIPAALRQQGNLPPVADHQQDIAELQRLVDHRTIHRFAIALHADDIETKPGAEGYSRTVLPIISESGISATSAIPTSSA